MNPRIRGLLLYALRQVLRPVVRLLRQAGVQYPEAARVLAGMYVEGFALDATVPARDRNLGVCSSVSGIAAPEIRDLLANRDWTAAPDRTLRAALGEVLSRWHNDLRFLGPLGVPLDLPFDAENRSSFTELVAAVDVGIDASRLADELIDAGLVTRTGTKHLKVLSRMFLLDGELSPQAIEHFGVTMPRLASTLQHNFDPRNRTKRFERAVLSDHELSAAQAEAFALLARNRVQTALEELDAWLGNVRNHVPDPQGTPIGRVGISVFEFVDHGVVEPELHLSRVNNEEQLIARKG